LVAVTGRKWLIGFHNEEVDYSYFWVFCPGDAIGFLLGISNPRE